MFSTGLKRLRLKSRNSATEQALPKVTSDHLVYSASQNTIQKRHYLCKWILFPIYRLQISISANTSLSSSRPFNEPRPLPPGCQWAPQSFYSASPWRPLLSWRWFTSCPWLPCQPPCEELSPPGTGTNCNKIVFTVFQSPLNLPSSFFN